MPSAVVAGLKAWVRSRPDLTAVFTAGVHIDKQPRSPASGAYVWLQRTQPPAGNPPVAEDDEVTLAHVNALIYAGTTETAEQAAVAYAKAVQSLTGVPVNPPGTTLTIRASDNVAGPVLVPAGPSTGELFGYSVDADFLVYG